MSRVAQTPMSPESVTTSIQSKSSWKSPSSTPQNVAWATSLVTSTDSDRSGYPLKPPRAARSGSGSQQQKERLRSPSRRRHTRTTSSASSGAATPVPFPNFDLGDGTLSFIAPLPETSSIKSPSGLSGSKVKVMSLHRKGSASRIGEGSLDLSKSMAENEAGGAYTATESTSFLARRPSASNEVRFGHQRSSSSVSHASAGTDSSARLIGGQYVHPMRQTPQAFTPPIARSLQASRAGSDCGDDPTASTSTLSPAASASTPFSSSFQATSPLGINVHPYAAPSRRRPSLNAAAHSRSGSQSTAQFTAPGSARYYPEVFSPDSAPQTARTSLDSMFVRKRSHPSLRHANLEDPYHYDQAAQELSRELFARQRAKDEKIAQREARIRDKEAVRAQRREQAHERKRSKSVTTEQSISPGSTPTSPRIYEKFEQGAYEIATTATNDDEDQLPTSDYANEKRPPIKRATKAAGNQWSSTGFRLKTFWIKIMRALGLRSRS